jgi:hypothetical protein
MLSHEWHNKGYVAVELLSGTIPERLLLFLTRQAKQGALQYELA